MLHRSDAVGRHTLRLREVLLERGVRSEIYVEMDDPETASATRPFTRYADEAEPGDVLVYQFATTSAIAPWLCARSETLIVNYHNVTPPEFYAPWNNGMARHQLLALTQLRRLAPRAALGVAVSAFNEAELRQAGFGRTAIVPPTAIVTTDPGAGARAAGARAAGARAVGATSVGARWLGVGRLAPNKAIERAVMALLVARAHHDPEATLQVVGRPVVPSYTAALHRFVAELGLQDAVRFAGAVSDDDLVEIMVGSDVLVVTSAHEGFGVPVLEALTLGIPVVANAAGALPEVVGDAGVLVDARDPYAVAAAAAGVVQDVDARTDLARAATTQLAALDLPGAAARMVDLLLSLPR
jgi:glycosyltransferase involved in cell wall biosynthesis